MIRKIKFRAWSKSIKMLFGSMTLEEIATGEYVTDFSKDIITQFTGLLDKNGKEIYEGDWVLFPNSATIEIHNTLFYITSQNCLSPEQCEVGEIIGNIYENPELK